MTNRRSFLASIGALLVPLTLWKRGDAPVPSGAVPPAASESSPRSSANTEFRRYRRQAARAQGQHAATPEPPLER
ncbi:MAG: hypothetical protein GEU90_00765 [Gemmatimonas sp.]|nr:hypothetical protein [Gemmatimonas sp.]